MDSSISQPSACDVIPGRTCIRREDVSDSKYGSAPVCKGCEAAKRESTGIQSRACRKRVDVEISNKEPDRCNRILEKVASMMEEDMQDQGGPGESAEIAAGHPYMANAAPTRRRPQEQRYQEGGGSSSDTQPAWRSNSGTLETPSVDEIEGMEGSTTNNN